jgi:TonB family protein
MIKHLLTLILSLLMFGAYAQKGTTVYYLTKTGRVVSSKEQADFCLMILPPDTSVDKHLFIVKEFYPNGKIGLITGSLTNALPLRLQGSYIAFFANGHKKDIKSFDNGIPVGDLIEYYPNGKLYDIKTYKPDSKLFLKQCNDSTGAVLAEDGNGKWIKFINGDFKNNYIEGEVKNGIEEGEWHGKQDDTTDMLWEYKEGRLISSKNFDKTGKEIHNKIFTSVEQVPEFPGGLEAFAKFLQKHLRYPEDAKENNRQGKVFISFVVEQDGTLTDIKIARGAGYGLDEEALRVMELSPRWKPGLQNGKPVRVQYSVPISFSLGNQ